MFANSRSDGEAIISRHLDIKQIAIRRKNRIRFGADGLFFQMRRGLIKKRPIMEAHELDTLARSRKNLSACSLIRASSAGESSAKTILSKLPPPSHAIRIRLLYAARANQRKGKGSIPRGVLISPSLRVSPGDTVAEKTTGRNGHACQLADIWQLYNFRATD